LLEYDNVFTDVKLLATGAVVIIAAEHDVLFCAVVKQADDTDSVTDDMLLITGNTVADVTVLLDVPDSDCDNAVTHDMAITDATLCAVFMLPEDNEHELVKHADTLCCPTTNDDDPIAGVQGTADTELMVVAACSNELEYIGATDLVFTDEHINRMTDNGSVVLPDGTHDTETFGMCVAAGNGFSSVSNIAVKMSQSAHAVAGLIRCGSDRRSLVPSVTNWLHLVWPVTVGTCEKSSTDIIDDCRVAKG